MENFISDNFEQLFSYYSQRFDTENIARLITVAKPLRTQDSQLQLWIWSAESYLARVRDNDNETAIQLRQQILQTQNVPPRLAARTWNGLGIAYKSIIRWDKALHAYLQAAERYEELNRPLDLSGVYINLAALADAEKSAEKTISHATKAIALIAHLPPTSKQQTYLGAAYNHLGLAHLRQAAFAEALTALQRALAIWQTQSNAWGEASALENIGDVYQQQGNQQRAEQAYRAALALCQQYGNRSQAGALCYAIGVVQDAIADAQGWLDRAYTIAAEQQYDELLIKTHLAYARIAKQLGDVEQRLWQTQAAIEIVESLRTEIVRPTNRARFAQTVAQAYEQMVDQLLARDDLVSAFRTVEMAKSRVLAEELDISPASEERNAAEQTLRKQLQTAYQAQDTARITTLEQALTSLRERLRAMRGASLPFTLVEPLTLAHVQRRLPTDSVLLEYFSIGEKIIVFVIEHDNVAVLNLTITTKQLRRVFRRVDKRGYGKLHGFERDEMGRLQDTWLLDKLHEMLLRPISATIERAKTLYIIPHDILHAIPFHVLRDQAGRYLFEREDGKIRPIIYAPNATILFHYCQRPQTTTPHGCLAVGYNDSQLTQAEIEATHIATLTEGAALTGRLATQHHLLREAAYYRYLHFSCHGWFNAVYPTLSSLALADGALQMDDITQRLRLNAQLVTLSACETGHSHILRGDEQIGMVRAFLTAGARAVLVTLWQVDEIATRLLMERFYTRVQSHSFGEALALAQNEVRGISADALHEWLSDTIPAPRLSQLIAAYASVAKDPARPFAHPFYWAAFALIGQPIPTV